jgi:hypothetical protein
MPLKLILKLVLLFTSLCATIVAIIWLRSDHMEAFWTSLGIGGHRINWCEERVESLYLFESSQKLFEVKNQWMWMDSDGDSRTLDYLRVEKWFAQYCQVDFNEPEVAPADGPFQPVFEAQFIDGGRITLYQNQAGLFKARNQIFASETLRQAIKELLAFTPKME